MSYHGQGKLSMAWGGAVVAGRGGHRGREGSRWLGKGMMRPGEELAVAREGLAVG